ncbi:MAG: phage tail tape measure protein, partial [Chloroflexi bacterium]|nr:phage tail tape measure protein [Chloroflexota bacterium]
MAAGARSRTMRLILAGDLDGLSRTLQRAQARGKGFGQTMKRASAVAAKALAGIAVAAAAMAASSVADFATFDKAVREVGTLLGDVSQNEISALGDDIRDVAKAFGEEAPQVARAFYDSISAGVANADTAKDFAESAARFATAGATDISTGVDLLSSAINAYGLTAADADKVSDTLFATVRAGKTTVAELAANFSQVGPVAASAGVGLEEVMGWVAQLTLSGTPTAQAMTQVRAALAELLNPAKKLSKNFAEVAGQTFPEFIASGGTLQEALALIQTHADDTGMGMTEMTSRIEGAMALLGATGDNADRFADTLASVADSAGATDTAFGVMSEGIDFRLRQLKAGFADFKLQVGEAVVPHLEWALDKGPKILEFIKDHADVLKPLAIGLGGLVVALAAVKVATVAWNAVLAINPFVAITAAVIAAGILFYKFRDQITDALGAAYRAITGFVAAALDTFSGFVRHVATAIKAWIGTLLAGYDGLRWILDKIGVTIPDVSQRVNDAVDRAAAAVEGALGAAAQATRHHGQQIAATLDEWGQDASTYATAVADATTAASADFRTHATTVAETMPDAADAVAAAADAVTASSARASENTIRNLRSQEDAMATMWAGLAAAHEDANDRMVAASAARRAALLDDLVADLDNTCTATDGMNACQQRLANDWNLYGGQMVESTSYFVGSWTEARALLADQVAAAAEAVETGSSRIVKATEDAAADVTTAADDMATALYGSMSDIESSMSFAARALGYDLDDIKAQFGELPAVANAVEVQTAEALQRLADAFGLTVDQVRGHLDQIPARPPPGSTPVEPPK